MVKRTSGGFSTTSSFVFRDQETNGHLGMLLIFQFLPNKPNSHWEQFKNLILCSQITNHPVGTNLNFCIFWQKSELTFCYNVLHCRKMTDRLGTTAKLIRCKKPLTVWVHVLCGSHEIGKILRLCFSSFV